MQNNKLRYIYLDDNEETMRNGDVMLMNKSSSRIEIVTDYPSSFNYRSNQIFADLESIDGLILDWELTNNSPKAKEGATSDKDIDFTAESLAEYVRSYSAQNGKKDIPIIICSADKNKAFTSFRLKEQTSQDLFDLAVIKSDLFNNKIVVLEPQLYELAKLYKTLTDPTLVQVQAVLGLQEPALSNLDVRFVDRIQTMLKTKTTHDIIQFLLREFIEKEGLLINEQVLAARLGADIPNSKENWQKIRDIVVAENVVYRGFLSIGWLNFWAFELELWWEKNFPGTELRILRAKERVKLLNEKFNLNLIAAEPIKFCSSEEYWTICYGLERPIDPIDAYRIGEEPLFPWQNPQYVSALAELEKKSSNDWRINVLDREQFNKFKTFLTKK